MKGISIGFLAAFMAFFGCDSAEKPKTVEISSHGNEASPQERSTGMFSMGMPYKDFQLVCGSEKGNCADGIQNNDEGGIDCGGICPPCNTKCNTPARYAPPDTPCTGHFVSSKDDPRVSDEGISDQYRIDYTWTDSGLELECQFFEVCDEGLDHVIEEALQCCSSESWDDVFMQPDPGLCREAIIDSEQNCKRCTGLYIINGLGRHARWMQGYDRNKKMDYTIGGDTMDVTPAEKLINVHHTGICRDYALAVTTLLRKAGYLQREIVQGCDGEHCYNLVLLPGDEKWLVVDTTGNSNDINFEGLPSDYPYCSHLNERAVCYNGFRTYKDVDAYWYAVDNKLPLPERVKCDGTETQVWKMEPQCGPGLFCGVDNVRLPDYAPSILDILGCEGKE